MFQIPLNLTNSYPAKEFLYQNQHSLSRFSRLLEDLLSMQTLMLSISGLFNVKYKAVYKVGLAKF